MTRAPHAPSEPCVAQLEAVRVFRRGTQALFVDGLRLAQGECLGVIGPNGAGKSTLLALLSGLLLPQSGSVRLFGDRLDRSNRGAVRKRVATVAQLADVDPRLPISVLESVMVGGFGKLGLWRRPGRALRQKALAALERMGIAHLASRPLGLVSGGERQRTAIARALTQEPDLLLLDEPTSALDWKAQRETLALLRDILSGMELTVVLVTHDLNAVPGMCSRVCALKGGVVAWTGPAAHALDPRRLAAIYGAPFEVLTHAGKPVVLL